jgi:hypothetical protein
MDLVDFERLTQPMLDGAIHRAEKRIEHCSTTLTSIATSARKIERLLTVAIANQEKLIELLGESKDKGKDKKK